MKEKVMVSDALAGINASLASFGNMIPQTENEELRAKLVAMRNCAEQSQYELYKLAKERKYYMPARMSVDDEIKELKDRLTEITTDSCTSCL